MSGRMLDALLRCSPRERLLLGLVDATPPDLGNAEHAIAVAGLARCQHFIHGLLRMFVELRVSRELDQSSLLPLVVQDGEEVRVVLLRDRGLVRSGTASAPCGQADNRHGEHERCPGSGLTLT